MMALLPGQQAPLCASWRQRLDVEFDPMNVFSSFAKVDWI